VIESFSTDPEDEIILNEENVRPDYSQTEDTATYDDFRLQGIMRNVREKIMCRQPDESGKYSATESFHKCKTDCVCVGECRSPLPNGR